MGNEDGSIGRAGFAERHGLWDAERADAAARIERKAEELGLEMIRLTIADQHGILRGKSIVAAELASTLRNGCALVSTLMTKDTSHRTVVPAFSEGGGIGVEEMSGAGDIIMLPDPSTFRVLPWSPGTGWLLSDIYFLNGKPVPFSTREILRSALGQLADIGYDFVSGLEVEFYLFKMDDPNLRLGQGGQPAVPPDVSLIAHGFQYLTENRLDEYDPYFQVIRRHLMDIGLPLRTMEIEFGPGQVEFTFAPGVGLDPADQMVLFRSAMKQICRRMGLHVTFMCRPMLPDTFSSGWHLHQSLRDRKTGKNAFVPTESEGLLPPIGRQFVAGILEHARAASVFSTPTINGYKRLQPYSLAPDRVTWSGDNRGAMIRVSGGSGDGSTNIENRVGEPAANPYLYMASQILAGLDGIKRSLEPPEPVTDAYEVDAPLLPKTLWEALTALDDDPFYREVLGDQFIDYIQIIKRAEYARYEAGPEDWEQLEYFELF